MKIAYFTDTYPPEINGVTNTLSYLTAYLHRERIEHLVFAPDYDGEPAFQEDNVIRFKGTRLRLNPASRAVIPPYRTVLDSLSAFSPNVVHITTEFGIGMSGLRAARELGIPIVMSYHTNFNQYLKSYDLSYLEKPYWGYMKWFHSFAAVNLCPSFDTLRDLEAKGFPRLGIWSRGIDRSLFTPESYSEEVRAQLGGRDSTVILYVGRLSAEKGLDTYARAARLLCERYSGRVSFVFTGDGPYREELADMHLPSAVFTGFQQKQELAQIYASSDLFVFPSGTETFGNVLLEAMSCGLPSICTNSGGVTDFAIHRKNAYVCDYGSDESLAQGMEALLCDEALRDSLRRGALRTAEERSWDRIFDCLIGQYERVMEAAPLSPYRQTALRSR